MSTEPVDDSVSRGYFRIWYLDCCSCFIYSAPGIWNRSGSIDALFTGIDARVAAAWSLVPADCQCQFSATRGESPVHLDVQPAWQSLSQALSVSVLVGDSAFEIQYVYSQFQLYQLPRTLRIRPPCQLQRRHNCGSGLFSSATNGSSFDCFVVWPRSFRIQSMHCLSLAKLHAPF